jgi:hypothetical protein
MSYHRHASYPDSVEELFSRYADFYRLAPRLLEAADDDAAFMNWFEKLILIDARALLLYIRIHKKKFTEEQIAYAVSRYNGKEI